MRKSVNDKFIPIGLPNDKKWAKLFRPDPLVSVAKQMLCDVSVGLNFRTLSFVLNPFAVLFCQMQNIYREGVESVADRYPSA